jgi:hypothetical protein
VVSLRGWIGTPIVALHLLVLLARPSSLSAQLASAGGGLPAAESHARSYDALFDELLRMSPRSDGVAEVSNLTLQRDVARFTLQSGQIRLLTPVGGRTVGAVFRGGDMDGARVYWFVENTILHGRSSGSPPYSHTDPDANLNPDGCPPSTPPIG